MAESATEKVRGEPYEDRRREDKGIIERWAEDARQKLRNVDGAST